MVEYELQMQSTAAEIKEQVNSIQEIMKAVMKDGTHYGKIPGCGDKPSLLKPGAEKLSLTFHLHPIIDNNRDIRIEPIPGHEGHREVSVYCHVMSPSGNIEVATGIGSCSTMESKYRYRGGEKVPTENAVPKEYWNLKKEGKFEEAKKSIGGSGYGVSKIDGTWRICEIGEKMENPDIADTYNTVLKMAKKRAYVDGILSATAASDIFAQDYEDLPEDIRETVAEESELAGHKPAINPTTSKTEANNVKSLMELMGKSGASKEEITAILKNQTQNPSKLSKTEIDDLTKLFAGDGWKMKLQEIATLEKIADDI